MSELTARLVEVYHLGGETAGVLDIPAKFWPEPGQYLPCQLISRKPDSLTIPLYKVLGSKGSLSVGPLPDGWVPGDRIAFAPPQGRGFKVPASARRIGLMAINLSPVRVLTLVDSALAQNAAVSLFHAPNLPSDLLTRLPSVVEINPHSSLLDNLDWPDYLAVEVERDHLETLSSFLGQNPLGFPGQVLVQTAMPCRGIGKCAVCAMKTSKGWRLTCEDGPVFPLGEVIHVAQ